MKFINKYFIEAIFEIWKDNLNIWLTTFSINLVSIRHEIWNVKLFYFLIWIICHDQVLSKVAIQIGRGWHTYMVQNKINTQTPLFLWCTYNGVRFKKQIVRFFWKKSLFTILWIATIICTPQLKVRCPGESACPADSKNVQDFYFRPFISWAISIQRYIIFFV